MQINSNSRFTIQIIRYSFKESASFPQRFYRQVGWKVAVRIVKRKINEYSQS